MPDRKIGRVQSSASHKRCGRIQTMNLGIPGSIGIVWPRKSREASANEMVEVVNMVTAVNVAGVIPDIKQRLQHFVEE